MDDIAELGDIFLLELEDNNAIELERVVHPDNTITINIKFPYRRVDVLEYLNAIQQACDRAYLADSNISMQFEMQLKVEGSLRE